MPATVYYESDADLGNLEGKTVAVIGYGSQGHAHALNLHDSGVSVVVGVREGGGSWEKAKADGLDVKPIAEAVKAADVIMVLVPDMVQPKVYEEQIAPNLSEGDTLMFAHGFNIRYGQITPPENVDVSMIAPKAPGHRVREVYQEGGGVPALLAVEQDYSGKAKENALAYAKGLGVLRAGVIETTFTEETETDLFGEQAVLCGGVTELIKAGFDTLVKAGYQPEVAYFECLHELKLIVDLMYQGGMSYMWYSVSETAEHGGYTAGPRVVDDAAREEMQGLLHEIQNGDYARKWIEENAEGRPNFNRWRDEAHEHMIEEVGARLRGMMSFIDPKNVEDL
jgi:ketol-acid reductoisomerase